MHDSLELLFFKVTFLGQFDKLFVLLGILLVTHVFDSSHSFSLCVTKLFALLVPTPFVNLRFCEGCHLGNISQNLLGPVWILAKRFDELLELLLCLTLTLANDFFKLTSFLIKHMSTLLWHFYDNPIVWNRP